VSRLVARRREPDCKVLQGWCGRQIDGRAQSAGNTLAILLADIAVADDRQPVGAGIEIFECEPAVLVRGGLRDVGRKRRRDCPFRCEGEHSASYCAAGARNRWRWRSEERRVGKECGAWCVR